MINEVRISTTIEKKHKFEDNEVDKTVGKTKGFTHVGSVEGHDLYHRKLGGKAHDYVMTKDGSNKIHTHLSTFEKQGGVHHVNFVQGKPGHGPGVHHLYHHLITKHDVVLTSKTQSPGGTRVWQKMSKMKGIHIHAVDARGKGHHVDLDDTSHTHVKQSDVDMATDKKEAKHLKSVMSMRLVAHKPTTNK